MLWSLPRVHILFFFHPINTKLHCVYHHCFAFFSFSGWPPCQWSDMTSVEVSQRAYNLLCIRDIWSFVICMKLMSTWYGICIYFCWINFCVCLSHGWHELNGSRCPLSEKGRKTESFTRMFMGPLFQIQQHLLSLTHWISKLPRRFEIDRVRQYLVNSMGLVGKVNAAVYKTETIFTALAFGKFSQFFYMACIFSQCWHVGHLKA